MGQDLGYGLGLVCENLGRAKRSEKMERETGFEPATLALAMCLGYCRGGYATKTQRNGEEDNP